MTKHLVLCLIFAVGCSSNEEKPKEKIYSNDTNHAFEMIERGDSYYLKQAPRQKEEIIIDEIRSTQKTVKNTKAQERLIEINQNLAFYCMKQRKNPAFGGDEAKCMKFVNKIMDDCQKKHRIVNKKLLSCIQTRLKNQR